MREKLNFVFSTLLLITTFSSSYADFPESPGNGSQIDPEAYLCPSGLQLYRAGQCRGPVRTNVTEEFSKARAVAVNACAEIRAFPIIIKNQEEQDYWKGGQVNYRVLGIVCNGSQWIWADGSVITYKSNYNYNSDLNGACTPQSDMVWWINTNGMWDWSNTAKLATKTFDFYCMWNLHSTAITDDHCVDSYLDGAKQTCYQLSEATENWADAQKVCAKINANVSSVHTAEENSYIRQMAADKGFVYGLLLGAALAGKANTFGWLDGSTWNYTNFVKGFPAAGYGDCLVMDTGDAAGLWINTDCSIQLPFVCARKPLKDDAAEECPGPNDVVPGETIHSPGFPMSATTPCEYFLKVAVGKLVEMEVLILEANACCDHLVIYEGSFGANYIANLTGSMSGSTFRTTSSNVMRVAWQPNGALNVRGLAFTFREV